MGRYISWITVILFFFASQPLQAQKNLTGIIQNSKTGEPLPYANIQVKGTFYGTISNKEGVFQLKVKDLPDTLLIRYIGFLSKEVIVDESSPEKLRIFMEPTVLQMQPVVVTAEDPAVTIMREVIRRKKIWRKRLLTYKASAYTRVRLENDTSIVFISEAVSTLYWDKNKGPREIITGKKETANMPSDVIFASSSYLPNFYDDDIEIQGTKVLGPTHPDALKIYRFRLIGQRSMDNRTVYDIEVKPRGKLQPTCVGKISVLDEEYGMIDVDLRPGRAVIMPFPIESWNVAYKQQFSDFGQGVWLPVDVRVSGNIKISLPGLSFPLIRYQQISRITNYDVNVLLPDSLYKRKQIVSLDTLAVKRDTLLEKGGIRIPLTKREQLAYATIDSTMTLEKAFRPTGFLAWLMKIQVNAENEDGQNTTNQQKASTDSTQKKRLWNWLKGFAPILGYNRVDGERLGLRVQKFPFKRVRFTFGAEYKFGAKRWGGSAELGVGFGKKGNRDWLSLRYQENTVPRYRSNQYPLFYLDALSELGLYDYLDYYHVKGWELRLSRQIDFRNIRMVASLKSQNHASLETTSTSSLLGGTHSRPVNPRIQEGKLQALSLRIDFGNDYVPFGIVGQSGGMLEIEQTLPESKQNDFSYSRVALTLFWRIPTFFKRRLLPNTLDLFLVGATSKGNLPLQRYGILDVRTGAFSPFGVFRTIGPRPIQGEKYLAVFWEHNFRTVPFEILGLQSLVKRKIGLIIHGASGRTWLNSSMISSLGEDRTHLDRFYHEVGFSISGIFDLFRVDITFPLASKSVFLGFGFARIF